MVYVVCVWVRVCVRVSELVSERVSLHVCLFVSLHLGPHPLALHSPHRRDGLGCPSDGTQQEFQKGPFLLIRQTFNYGGRAGEQATVKERQREGTKDNNPGQSDTAQ